MTLLLAAARRALPVLLAAAAAAGGAAPLASSPASASPAPVRAAAAAAATPGATCGPGSLPETGLQGEVPLVDQLDGRSLQGYRCNLELVGQYAGDGGALMLAWYGRCAYMPTGYAATDPEFETKKGVVVLDVSDPERPVETARLQTPAMINPWESLKVNQRTGLLAAGEGGSFPVAGPGASGPVFDVYDVKTDCTRPRLLSSSALPDTKGHEGDWAPDGRTYYQSTLRGAPDASIVAIDATNPRAPRQVATFSSALGPVHAVDFSPDGNRGYFAVAAFNGGELGNDGIVIADTSQVQARRKNPKITVISSLFWKDGAEAQLARRVRIGGRPYLITTDEFGAQANPQQACAQGQNPYGFVHVVDIADEKAPTLTGTVQLEVNDPANCATVLPEQNAALSLMYSAHYCTPDDPADTRVIACSWLSSGVRLLDVRNPAKPREIAYYNAPARVDLSSVRGSAPVFDALVGTRTKDVTSTQVRWTRDPRTGERQLWYLSSAQGFQVLRLTNGVYPRAAAAPSTASAAPTRRPAGAAPSRAPVAAGPGGGALPATGPTAPLGAGLVALLLAGGLLRVAGRRRSTAPSAGAP